MPCGCNNKGPQYAVVTEDNKTVFVTKNAGTAAAVSRRYVGSHVEEIVKT